MVQLPLVVLVVLVQLPLVVLVQQQLARLEQVLLANSKIGY